MITTDAVANLYGFDSGMAWTTAQIAERLETKPDNTLLAALAEAEKRTLVRCYKKRFQDPKKWVWIRL